MPTSATSLDQRLGPKKTSTIGQRQRGFTLVELLVVLAIGAMLIGLVPMAFSKLQEGSQYRDTVRSLVIGLRQSRQRAISTGHAAVFQIDLAQRQFGLQGEPQRPFPNSIEIKTVVGQLDTPPANGMAQITFLPEGGATGGTIELARPSGAGVRIRIDWLLGQITQEPRAP